MAMGAGALLAVLTLLALTSSACSELLQQDLWNYTKNCSHCDDQLLTILNISAALVKQHISAHNTAEADDLGQRLSGACKHGKRGTDILQSVRASLGPLRRLAETDSILAILGRRIILACIVLHKETLKNDVPQEELQSFLADVTKVLYGTHVDTVFRKALLDYLHISKSGGTSFSQAARLSRCSMAPGIGQPVYIGDLPHWINRTLFYELTGNTHIYWSIYGRIQRGEVVGCRARIANVTARGLQYLSNEYTLHGGYEGMERVHVCRRAVNVVTLRSPEARLVSHLHFLLAHIKARITRRLRKRAAEGGKGGSTSPDAEAEVEEAEGAAAAATGRAEDGEAEEGVVPGRRRDLAAAEEGREVAADGAGGGRDLFRDTFCAGNTTAMWRSLTPAIMDNYNVRSFIGERAFHTPYGGIGPEHLAVARRLLLQFDLVMDLDAGEEAADLIMYQGLGWNVTLAEVHARSQENVALALKYNRTECANEGLLADVLPRQGPDRELYSTGRVLSLLDQLLLGWARQLGLQPRRPHRAGASQAGSDGGEPSRCGMVGHAPPSAPAPTAPAPTAAAPAVSPTPVPG